MVFRQWNQVVHAFPSERAQQPFAERISLGTLGLGFSVPGVLDCARCGRAAEKIGPAEAIRYTVNIQPVIPLSLTTDWNFILRTIMPVIYDEAPVPGGDNRAGGYSAELFFSPKAPTRRGWVWGAGPVFLYPSATDDALGTEKFALGPTAVVLKQQSGWTYGMLANHLWSVAGNSHRDDVSATFMNPFLVYTTKTFTSFHRQPRHTSGTQALQTSPLSSIRLRSLHLTPDRSCRRLLLLSLL